MNNYPPNPEYAVLKAAVLRRAWSIYAVRAMASAAKRTAFLFLSMLALVPVFEVGGRFSVQDILGNIPKTDRFGDMYGFFSSALINTEIEVQVITGLCLVVVVGITSLFMKDLFFRGHSYR